MKMNNIIFLFSIIPLVAACGIHIGNPGSETGSGGSDSSSKGTGTVIFNFSGLAANKKSLSLNNSEGNQIGVVKINKAIASIKYAIFHDNEEGKKIERSSNPVFVYDIANENSLTQNKQTWSLPSGKYNKIEIGLQAPEEEGIGPYSLFADVEISFNSGEVINIEIRETANLTAFAPINPLLNISPGKEVLLKIFMEPDNWFNFEGFPKKSVDRVLERVKSNQLQPGSEEFKLAVNYILANFFRSIPEDYLE